MTTRPQQGFYSLGEGPYRHQPPAVPCCPAHDMDLPEQQLRLAVAAHEAGHAVAAFDLGVPVLSVGIDVAWRERECGRVLDVVGDNDVHFNGSSFPAVLKVLAAGERAELRRLQEAGLWAPERAFHAERGGLADRQCADRHLRQAGYPGLSFGTGPSTPDWWLCGDEAERVLDLHWGEVLRLSLALANGERLSGDQAAELVGTRNRPPLGD